MLFRLFPQFCREFTCPMRFLTGCLTKTLDIGTRFSNASRFLFTSELITGVFANP